MVCLSYRYGEIILFLLEGKSLWKANSFAFLTFCFIFSFYLLGNQDESLPIAGHRGRESSKETQKLCPSHFWDQGWKRILLWRDLPWQVRQTMYQQQLWLQFNYFKNVATVKFWLRKLLVFWWILVSFFCYFLLCILLIIYLNLLECDVFYVLSPACVL